MSAISEENGCKAKGNAMPDKKAHRKKILKRALIGLGVFVLVIAILIGFLYLAVRSGLIGQASLL